MEKSLQDVRSAYEQIKAHESGLEAQLGEYESMLKTLKENHQTELNSTVKTYQSEIRGLKEQIRVNDMILAQDS